jgi:hypothetical protein
LIFNQLMNMLNRFVLITDMYSSGRPPSPLDCPLASPTPGIPKYPFIMTNIYIIYQAIYAGISKRA